jgi:hypothetical protein
MKIGYIISTCDKYFDTRVKFQMETMFKNINKEDIYYLTSKSNIDKRQFGWNAMDDPQNITWKYIHFIYNMEIEEKYDWFIFIDDDTFVFHARLQNLLETFDSNEYYYIGCELDHIKNEYGLYMSGGAGYAISKSLYKLIYKYVKDNGINNSYKHWCDDLCIGLWIQDIAKENIIKQIHNDNFHLSFHTNDNELKDAITFHKVMNEDQYLFYSNLSFKEKEYINNENENEIKNDVFVLITDAFYFHKAKRSILDLRSIGNWHGEIVLMTIDFNLNQNFKDFYNITEAKFPVIDKTNLLNQIGENGFLDTTDKREIHKLNQWEKLHVFDEYFLKWSRVIYLDAGLRVLDDVKYLLELDCTNKILSPKDGKFYQDQPFQCQLSYDKPELIENFKSEFGETCLKSNYMLNCIWMYDTNILKICDKNQLIESMNKYTFCKTNEMGIMNILFHFKYKLWEAFPIKSSNGKFLFDWCELNQNYPTNWRDYCFIKYPVSITFEDT